MLGQILDSGEGPMTFQHPLVYMVNKANGGGGRKMCLVLMKSKNILEGQYVRKLDIQEL